jgi:hypothetical protein
MIEPGAPVKFSEAELEEFTTYVEQELDEALEEHSELEDRLDEWDMLYAAEPKEKRKTFPWPGAANVEIPIISIACDSIAARLLNTIFGVEPFWTVNPLRKEMEKFAKPVEHWLDWSRKNEFDLYGEVRKGSNELIRHGWNWYKLSWEIFSRRAWAPDGGLHDEVVRRPMVHHILNRDVIRQAGIEDDEQSEWLAHRFRISDNQLLLRSHLGYYDKDLLDDFKENKEDAYRIHQALRSSDMQPQFPREKLNTFYEIQIDWPYGKGKDHVPTPLLATFHRPSKKFARIIFHPYPWRTLKKVKFIEREGRAEGFGIAKRLDGVQREISTIHRQQVDNGTIANTKFFLGKKSSRS